MKTYRKYDGRNKFRPGGTAPLATKPREPETPMQASAAPAAEGDYAGQMKLHELQSFASAGLLSGSDGGGAAEQSDKAVLGIMYELGQFAREMRLKPLGQELKPAIARKRIGAMLTHLGEMATLHGVSLDAAAADRVNDLCADRRYQRPTSLS